MSLAPTKIKKEMIMKLITANKYYSIYYPKFTEDSYGSISTRLNEARTEFDKYFIGQLK